MDLVQPGTFGHLMPGPTPARATSLHNHKLKLTNMVAGLATQHQLHAPCLTVTPTSTSINSRHAGTPCSHSRSCLTFHLQPCSPHSQSSTPHATAAAATAGHTVWSCARAWPCLGPEYEAAPHACRKEQHTSCLRYICIRIACAACA